MSTDERLEKLLDLFERLVESVELIAEAIVSEEEEPEEEKTIG